MHLAHSNSSCQPRVKVVFPVRSFSMHEDGNNNNNHHGDPEEARRILPEEPPKRLERLRHELNDLKRYLREHGQAVGDD